jgi:hypothetical protein
MSILLDVVLAIAVIGAVVDGFRTGIVKGALRLIGLLAGLVVAGVVLRVLTGARGPLAPVVIFFIYVILPGVFSGIVELVYRILFGSADLASDEPPGVRLKRLTRQVFVAEPNRSLLGRILGMVFSGVAAGISNGVFVLALRVLNDSWVNDALAGSGLAGGFVDAARQVAFLLPPELHLW